MTAKKQAKQRIAQECARIIAEEGITDYMAAKRKAVLRLRVEWTGPLPRNEEVDQALAEYHRLFQPAKHALHIRQLRTNAVVLMQFLQAFSPRLVGNVLTGNAGPFCPITLHLFVHAPEDVLIQLIDGNIPFTEQSHELLSPKGNATHYPAIHFVFDNTNIILKLFPSNLLFYKPKKCRKEKASASISASVSASIQAVRSLIDERP